MRKTIKTLRAKIKTIENKNNDNNDAKYKNAISSIFYEDQVKALMDNKRV